MTNKEFKPTDPKEFKANYLKEITSEEKIEELVSPREEQTAGITKPFYTEQNVILTAINIPYDNTVSWLTAENVQDAIDELKTLIP